MAKRADATVKEVKSLRDLSHDPNNANRHTQRGSGMMVDSIQETGFGDSITVDKRGRIISGNGRTEALGEIGMIENPIVVQSDGTRPIIHQRTDLDLETDDRAKKLAIYQNRVGETNLDWSPDVLRALSEDGTDLSKMFTDEELAALIDEPEAEKVKPLTVDRPTDVVWVLLAIPLASWPAHQAAVEAMQLDAKFSTQVLRPNEPGKDGNNGQA
jgi:hypothetical protein